MNDDLVRMCFGCGQDNPYGLHLHVHQNEDGWWESDFVPQPFHCGWPGIVHGGILSTVLDEVMSYVAYGRGLFAFTAKLSVDFKRYASPGQHLKVRSRAIRETRRIIDCYGEIRKDDGMLIANAEGKMVVLTDEQRRKLGFPERIRPQHKKNLF